MSYPYVTYPYSAVADKRPPRSPKRLQRATQAAQGGRGLQQTPEEAKGRQWETEGGRERQQDEVHGVPEEALQ